MRDTKKSRRKNLSSHHAIHSGPIELKRGETVRIVAHNRGKVLHEMVLGRIEELKEHAELMRKFPNMEHDEPHMAHVDPGKRGNMVRHFDKPGEFFIGCLISGHFEARMIGSTVVK